MTEPAFNPDDFEGAAEPPRPGERVFNPSDFEGVAEPPPGPAGGGLGFNLAEQPSAPEQPADIATSGDGGAFSGLGGLLGSIGGAAKEELAREVAGVRDWATAGPIRRGASNVMAGRTPWGQDPGDVVASMTGRGILRAPIAGLASLATGETYADTQRDIERQMQRAEARDPGVAPVGALLGNAPALLLPTRVPRAVAAVPGVGLATGVGRFLAGTGTAALEGAAYEGARRAGAAPTLGEAAESVPRGLASGAAGGAAAYGVLGLPGQMLRSQQLRAMRDPGSARTAEAYATDRAIGAHVGSVTGGRPPIGAVRTALSGARSYGRKRGITTLEDMLAEWRAANATDVPSFIARSQESGAELGAVNVSAEEAAQRAIAARRAEHEAEVVASAAQRAAAEERHAVQVARAEAENAARRAAHRRETEAFARRTQPAEAVGSPVPDEGLVPRALPEGELPFAPFVRRPVRGTGTVSPVTIPEEGGTLPLDLHERRWPAGAPGGSSGRWPPPPSPTDVEALERTVSPSFAARERGLPSREQIDALAHRTTPAFDPSMSERASAAGAGRLRPGAPPAPPEVLLPEPPTFQPPPGFTPRLAEGRVDSGALLRSLNTLRAEVVGEKRQAVVDSVIRSVTSDAETFGSHGIPVARIRQLKTDLGQELALALPGDAEGVAENASGMAYRTLEPHIQNAYRSAGQLQRYVQNRDLYHLTRPFAIAGHKTAVAAAPNIAASLPFRIGLTAPGQSLGGGIRAAVVDQFARRAGYPLQRAYFGRQAAQWRNAAQRGATGAALQSAIPFIRTQAAALPLETAIDHFRNWADSSYRLADREQQENE